MNLTETNSFRCMQSVPGYTPGTEYIEEGLSNYPKVFSKVYKFDTGERICFGDDIYKIASNNGTYNKEVKCVKFSSDHLKMEVFSTFEEASKRLKQMIEENNKISENNSVKSFLTLLKTVTNKETDECTINEIKARFIWIKDNLKNINYE